LSEESLNNAEAAEILAQMLLFDAEMMRIERKEKVRSAQKISWRHEKHISTTNSIERSVLQFGTKSSDQQITKKAWPLLDDEIQFSKMTIGDLLTALDCTSSPTIMNSSLK